MLRILWDASALAKGFCPESGSATVDRLLHTHNRHPMAVAILGYAEVYALLTRKRNAGLLGATPFKEATLRLQHDILFSPLFQVLDITPRDVLEGMQLIRRHNLNSSDAAILTTFLRYAAASGEQTCILVASDRRLLRAAREEGLRVLNPESVAAEEVPSLLQAWG